MNKNDLIQEIKRQIHDIEIDINNYEEKISFGAVDLSMDYQQKIKKLVQQKEKLKTELVKFEADQNTFFDDAKIVLQKLFHQLAVHWDTIKLEYNIKKNDYELFDSTLQKLNQRAKDYQIEIDIKELITPDKKIVAKRLVKITFLPTTVKRIYSTTEGESWGINFEEDLKTGFFQS